MGKKKTTADRKADRHVKLAVSLRLPPELVARINAFAEKHGRPATLVYERALIDYLDRYESLPALEEQVRKANEPRAN